MTVGAGLLERTNDGSVYNAYVVAMADGTWAIYRKLHVFEHPGISAGDRYTVFNTPHGCRLGVLICYDNNIGGAGYGRGGPNYLNC
jgi:5-aminopentanamidase